uniref:Transcription repressor n=1 Tax=Arundo donax TaxID=35708 RepID=A0A0A9FCK1_ARUDO
MVEMVAGRRIRGADALSELLVWYLSLNSPHHHAAILAAFEDVWDAVLGSDP